MRAFFCIQCWGKDIMENTTYRALLEAAEHLRAAQDCMKEIDHRPNVELRKNLNQALALVESLLSKGR